MTAPASESFGSTVRAKRERLPRERRSLRNTAARLEISFGYLAELERGRRSCSDDVLNRIADDLGLSRRLLRRLRDGAQEVAS